MKFLFTPKGDAESTRCKTERYFFLFFLLYIKRADWVSATFCLRGSRRSQNHNRSPPKTDDINKKKKKQGLLKYYEKSMHVDKHVNNFQMATANRLLDTLFSIFLDILILQNTSVRNIAIIFKNTIR